jgi:universal stress protein A
MPKGRQPAGRTQPREGGFHHILVPTDLTERTGKALELASQLAAGRVTLLHVVETIEGLPREELQPFYERLERKARKAMELLTQHARREAPAVARVVVLGRRAEEIVRYAAANEVDLIVLASHRVKPSRIDRDWGTMSYKVGILAQCPVLLVK